MKFYLSSYELGKETEKLKTLIKDTNRKFGYIPNALDFTDANKKMVAQRIKDNMKDFSQHGAEVEVLDLKKYFNKKSELKNKLIEMGGIYVSGGNTFVLRQAFKLSGLDEIIIEMKDRKDFLYVAYSAGVCLLCPSLKPFSITDNADDFPYKEIKKTIWDGLGIIDFTFEPHFDSDHPESKSTDKEIKYCIDNKILFRAYRDGEVLIV